MRPGRPRTIEDEQVAPHRRESLRLSTDAKLRDVVGLASAENALVLRADEKSRPWSATQPMLPLGYVEGITRDSEPRYPLER